MDGLRAVAVSAVVLYHLDHRYLPGGFVGVDVFFVISGFVVTGSLLRQRHDSLGSFLLAFYSRRVKRLTPALFCAVLVCSLCTSLLVSPHVAHDLPDYYVSGSYGLLGWANNHFAARGTAYSDQGPEALEYNPFTHLWSLGVEEQFYFLFPLLIALGYGKRVIHKPAAMADSSSHGGKTVGAASRRRRRQQREGETAQQGAASPLAALPSWCSPATVLLSFASISLVASTVLTYTPHRQMLAFYLLPSRAWQLVAGGALYALQEPCIKRSDRLQDDSVTEGSGRDTSCKSGQSSPQLAPARSARALSSLATEGDLSSAVSSPATQDDLPIVLPSSSTRNRGYTKQNHTTTATTTTTTTTIARPTLDMGATRQQAQMPQAQTQSFFEALLRMDTGAEEPQMPSPPPSPTPPPPAPTTASTGNKSIACPDVNDTDESDDDESDSETEDEDEQLPACVPLARALPLVALFEASVIASFVIAFTCTPGVDGFPVPWSFFAIGAAVGSIALGSPSLWPEALAECRTYCTGVPCPLLPACLGCASAAYIGRLSCK